MMDGFTSLETESPLAILSAAAARIRQIQSSDGAIAWFENGPWDPWNHSESVMALTAMGEQDAARAGLDYLAKTQRADGAWLGGYGNALPMVNRDYISREAAPECLDSNFCAYPAVAVAHYLLATGDIDQTRIWWPMIRAAIDFVLSLQRADGTISWAKEAVGTSEDDALLAGNASIAKSLACAIMLAERLGQPCQVWRAARARLITALRDHPERFDRRGTGGRFAMDWYYPVLSGALCIDAAQQRIFEGWDRFVAPDLGCLCVADEPWVTVAETAELALALISIGDRKRAERLLQQIRNYQTADGVFWMGWQYKEAVYWPREQPSWTQAAVILATDALHNSGAASQLLVG